MTIVRTGLIAILSIACCSPAVAAADETSVTPAVETCTLDKQRQSGDDCLVCDAWRGDVAKCQKRLGPRGFERRCRGAGESAWSEVWCKAPGAASAPTPPAPSRDR